MMTRWPTGQSCTAPLGRFPGSSRGALRWTPCNSPWPRFLALTSSSWMTAWTWMLYQRTPCCRKQRQPGSKTGAATEGAGAEVVLFKTLISSELQPGRQLGLGKDSWLAALNFSKDTVEEESLAGLIGASDTRTGSFLSTFNTSGGRFSDIFAGEAACAGSA